MKKQFHFISSWKGFSACHQSHYSGVLLHLSNPFSLRTRTPGLLSSTYSKTGLSYASCDSSFGSTEVLCVEMWSSSPSSRPSSGAELQQTVALVMRRSSGLRERIHWGRKSQVWSLAGRWRGLRLCITFTMTMKTVTPRNGAPTPASTRHPARERPSTSEGSSKKQRRR